MLGLVGPRAVLLGALLLSGAGLGLGCTTLTQNPPGRDDSASDDPTTTTPDPYPGIDVAFEKPRIEISPGETLEVRLRATPAGVYPIRIALFGDALGAYTDTNEVLTDARGRASIELTVPLDSKQLTLRASIGHNFSDLPVTIARFATGNLKITPQYSGARPIENWAVSTQADVPCEGLAIADAHYGPVQRSLPLNEAVPANRTITLLVRGDEYVFGCRDGLFIEASKAQDVTIGVIDRPMQLSALNTPLTLGFEPSEAFTKELEAIILRMLAAFRGDHDQDVAALLSRMSELSQSPSAFSLASDTEDWLGQLVESLTPRGAETGLSSYVQVWLNSGLHQLFTTDTLHGQLTGNIPPSSRALLQLDSVAGFEPRSVGVPNSFVLSVANPPVDDLQLAFDFVWQPAKLLSALAEEAAVVASNTDGGISLPGGDAGGTVSGAVGVLAEGILHCANVASLLSGPDAVAFEGCDQSCLAALCTAALGSMWQDLKDAEHPLAAIQITSRQHPELDKQARPIGFQGPWVGKATFGDSPLVDIAGPLAAGPVKY